MRIKVLLGGTALACSLGLLPVAAGATSQGALVVADNDQHKDEHKGLLPGGGQPAGQPPQGGGQGQSGWQVLLPGQQHGSKQGGGQQGPSGPQSHGWNGQPGGNMMMQGQHHDHSNGQNMMQGQHHDHSNGQNMMQGGNAMMGHGNGDHQNFDRHAFQRNFNATRHFHADRYRRPDGWYNHRWVYGEILPAFFWSQNYWIGDYYDYDLPDPPPGFIWIR